jgi:hypothetical protein
LSGIPCVGAPTDEIRKRADVRHENLNSLLTTPGPMNQLGSAHATLRMNFALDSAEHCLVDSLSQSLALADAHEGARGRKMPQTALLFRRPFEQSAGDAPQASQNERITGGKIICLPWPRSRKIIGRSSAIIFPCALFEFP